MEQVPAVQPGLSVPLRVLLGAAWSSDGDVPELDAVGVLLLALLLDARPSHLQQGPRHLTQAQVQVRVARVHQEVLLDRWDSDVPEKKVTHVFKTMYE